MAEQRKNLRLILGLKLKKLRTDEGVSLREIANRAGLSVSYLSELEQGKKYPKPDKLFQLADALAVPYDDLVSLRVSDELGPLKEAMSSELLQEFPFELFGLEREDLVRLISDTPEKSGALIQTLVEVGRSYDVQVEQFLLSALRSYQQMHANYFEDLEEAAMGFRSGEGWSPEDPVTKETLQAILEQRWGYRIDEETITDHPQLGSFRSVFVDGSQPVLYVNGKLLEVQKAFILAREIGYRRLGLKERAVTSSWIRVESFAQVLNNFKASYFSGALLMDRGVLGADLSGIFDQESWDPQALVASMERFGATPEMFLYRLTELMPSLFGLEKIFFLRFQKKAESDRVALTKVFNLSGVPVPYGVGLNEHYCRRWPGLQLLEKGAKKGDSPSFSQVAVQRSHFVAQDVDFLMISLARPLVLDPETRSSVTIGFLMDRALKRKVRFWNDPAIPQVEVDLTCERCPLPQEECRDRVAEPKIYTNRLRQEEKERALAELVKQNQGT
jgi:transcriptional regulator with XRE-family HTH domain/Zn-dependent peptidase ImmA (M78 family)